MALPIEQKRVMRVAIAARITTTAKYAIGPAGCLGLAGSCLDSTDCQSCVLIDI